MTTIKNKFQLLTATLLLISSSIQADQIATLKTRKVKVRKKTTVITKQKAKASISYERFVRLNQPEDGAKRDTFDWIESSYKYNMERGPIKGSFDGDLRFFIKKKQVNFSLSEAYLSYKGAEGSVHGLGRQKLDWHPNEAFWQLSHLQGLRNFRLMDRKQEGLLGYKLKVNSGNFKSEFFLSYFYVPTLNPGIKVNNGEVTSNSDWYRRPPKQALLRENGEPTDIKYEINEPDYKDIFIQKTLGAKLSLDWNMRDKKIIKKLTKKKKKKKSKKKEKSTFGKGEISGYVIYKPEANIRINASTQYNTIDSQLPVRADPIVNHHIVYGATLKQEIKSSKNVIGFTFVDPTARLGQDFDTLSLDVNDTVEAERTGYLIDPKYDKEAYLHFSSFLPGNLVSAGFNAIHYLTKHEQGNDDFYSDTVRWLSAVGVNLNYHISDLVTASVNLRYDLKRKDNLFDGSVTFKPYKRTFINVGLELIRSPSDNSYWSAYRANDTGYINFGMFY
jgi:hypothetical protein